jgi:hypothetical protein
MNILFEHYPFVEVLAAARIHCDMTGKQLVISVRTVMKYNKSKISYELTSEDRIPLSWWMAQGKLIL